MDAHPDREAEELLEALLTGAADERDVEVQTLFAARPRLRERYERLRRLAGDLDEVGAGDRARLAEDVSRPSRFDAAARELVERRSRPERRVPRWAIAAAALLVVGALAFLLLQPHAAGEDTTLAPATEGTLSPQGPVRAYERFTWRLPLPPGGTFAITFKDMEGNVLVHHEDLGVGWWDPTPDDLRKMKPVMQWEIESQDLNHRTQRSLGPVDVSLLPR